jgi:hypothetical protein
LQEAAEDRRLDVVEAIIELGYRMDLISAISLGRSDLVAKIIKNDPSAIYGFPKTGGGRMRQTPLMVEVGLGEKEIVELLLNAGADVNETYTLGFRSGPPQCGTATILYFAVLFRRIDLIELLMLHGANPKVDCDGASLLEYTKKYRTPEIVTLLEKGWPKKSQPSLRD